MLNFKRALLMLVPILLLFLTIESTSTANPPGEPVFVQEYIGQTDFIEGRLTQMLGAMSQDQMRWTPAEGVRTCGQIYLHVVEANYMLAGFMNGEEMEGEPGTMDKKTTNKDEIVKMLKDSFAAVKKAAGKLTEEDLNKVVKTPFGMVMSLRNFMISLLNHSHEHLGQGIAYARMNSVTPPWSKKESEG
jgi:uncharacterized damage-inducible protein DinB